MSDDSPYLLTEVTLRAFKAAFKPAPIPLRRFNVIIGRNGSGKSTLLEALQWIDTTIRRDAREASDRYHGLQDLVNLRAKQVVLGFELGLEWRASEGELAPLRYKVRVEEADGVARIASETLDSPRKKKAATKIIYSSASGERLVRTGPQTEIARREPDRLALGWLENVELEDSAHSPKGLSEFWRRAVFLRLSPNRLQEGSSATRRSFEPLLDEEGHTLPALLNELGDEQRRNLIEAISDILPGIRDVEVSKADHGRDTRVNYSLLEEMPYSGRSGKKRFPIPAWMLSEGTRRITAILALLVRDPAPTLLCIEEVENGLDPWTVRAILRHLQGAAARGTQVLLTTHSPWVLDDVPMDSILLVRRRGGDTQYEHFASLKEVTAFSPSLPAGTRYVNIHE